MKGRGPLSPPAPGPSPKQLGTLEQVLDLLVAPVVPPLVAPGPIQCCKLPVCHRLVFCSLLGDYYKCYWGGLGKMAARLHFGRSPSDFSAPHGFPGTAVHEVVQDGPYLGRGVFLEIQLRSLPAEPSSYLWGPYFLDTA